MAVPAVAVQGASDRAPEGQPLDPLRGPVRVELAAGHAQELLGVRAEERLVEHPAEAGHDPRLERTVLHRWAKARRRVAGDRSQRPPRPEVHQRVRGLERIVEEPPAVQDPGLP